MEIQRKKLDPLVVRFIATTLILAEGSTTTLAVQRALRRRGYDARRADVSQWLFVISLWENWTFEDTDQHRIFHFPRAAFSLQ